MTNRFTVDSAVLDEAGEDQSEVPYGAFDFVVGTGPKKIRFFEEPVKPLPDDVRKVCADRYCLVEPRVPRTFV